MAKMDPHLPPQSRMVALGFDVIIPYKTTQALLH